MNKRKGQTGFRNTLARTLVASGMFRSVLAAKRAENAVIGAIRDTVVRNGRVELRGFGVFTLRRIAPCRRRNPKTGEEVMVSERWTTRFRASTRMRGHALKGSGK